MIVLEIKILNRFCRLKIEVKAKVNLIVFKVSCADRVNCNTTQYDIFTICFLVILSPFLYY